MQPARPRDPSYDLAAQTTGFDCVSEICIKHTREILFSANPFYRAAVMLAAMAAGATTETMTAAVAEP